MKIVVFGTDRRVGAVVEDRVVDLVTASQIAAQRSRGMEPLATANLADLIALGDSGLDIARAAIEVGRDTGDGLGPDGRPIATELTTIELQPPVPAPDSRIMMAGGNYPDHLRDVRIAMGQSDITLEQVVEETRAGGPWHFVKQTRNVVGNGASVRHPRRTDRFDYEGEVTAVLAVHGRDLPASAIDGGIWGYTLQNDWSVRSIANLMDFGYYKNFDGSSSLGPWIVVDEIDDPQNVPFETRVDGELRQSGNTRDMIFSFGEFLEYLSRDMTIFPGDMIAAGTCSGTAMDSSVFVDGRPAPDLFLRPGQVVEVSSTSIGTLTNQVVEAS